METLKHEGGKVIDRINSLVMVYGIKEKIKYLDILWTTMAQYLEKSMPP